MKRFEDYKQEVILAYKKKKKEGTLPSNLQESTPANMKKECLAVFHIRYADNDSETFKDLYGERNNATEYLQKITITTADKFKPLDNFLKGITEDTKRRNIELLAWLIDFQPRPFSTIVQEKDPEPTPEGPADPKEPNNLTEKIIRFIRKSHKILGLFLALVIGIIIYIGTGPNEQCMYWDGIQYQSIACDQKVQGKNVIAQDTLRLHHLKKISNISSITRNDIRKIYYSKTDNKVEFYTTGGENPEDSRKRLLPMTEHMFRKYVLNEHLK